jgi:hypothetical protein
MSGRVIATFVAGVALGAVVGAAVGIGSLLWGKPQRLGKRLLNIVEAAKKARTYARYAQLPHHSSLY